MRFVVDVLYLVAALGYLPVAAYQALFQGKNRRGWAQRFGAAPRFDPSSERIWIHAVSLGEVNATTRLVEGLTRASPEREIVVSTTTDTGYARALQLYGPDRVFRFPLDFSFAVGRALERVRPSLIVLMELEVWYNLVCMASRRGIPVVVANGRLTAHSARRLGWLGRRVRPMFSSLAWVGAQDARIAERFRALGVREDRIEVTSSMKWDTAQVTDRVDGAAALRDEMGLDTTVPMWVCGSTGPGEEATILDAWDRLTGVGTRVRLVIVPRKPERFDEVYRLITSRGRACVRRSRPERLGPFPFSRSGPTALRDPSGGGKPPGLKPGARNTVSGNAPAGVGARDTGDVPVVLGDTMGELRLFYSLADVVFVGRSLVPMGGSDPIEVAALAKPMIAGPHMDNFREPVEAFEKVGALTRVGDAAQLASAVTGLLASPEHARTMGARARQVVLEHQGATERTVERLVALLREGRGSARPTGHAPAPS